MDLNHNLQNFSEKTKLLEGEYSNLKEHFHALKDKIHASYFTLESLIAYMNEGVMFVSEDGRIAMMNPAAAELLEIGSDKIMHKLFWDHFSDNFFGFSMRKSLIQFSHQRLFIDIGDQKEIEVSASYIPQKGILLLLRNRNEERILETGLYHTERLKELGEMAATLAHEIRNPLGGIEGFAELLKREILEPKHRAMIEAILEGTKALNTLVTDVLDYARPMPLHFASVDLIVLIKDTMSLASASFFKNGHLNFTTAYSRYSLSIDQEQIKRVLLNLLRNAVEAGATIVDIRLNDEGNVMVQDNGEGISQSNLKKIFTPFFTTKTRGTGLGLAHSLAAIKAHGGTMDVKSTIGSGSQFTIKIGTQCDLRKY